MLVDQNSALRTIEYRQAGTNFSYSDQAKN